MSPQKKVLIGGLIIITLLVWWWIAAINIFTSSPSELSASIIDAEKLAEETNIDNSWIIPKSNTDTQLPNDPTDITRQVTLPDTYSWSTRILIPPHIDVSALEQLVTRINRAEKYDISVNFLTPKTLEAYNTALSNRDYDVVLTTPEYMQKHNLPHIDLPLDPSMRSGIHPSAQKAARRENVFFVPFAVDPYVVAIDNNIWWTVSSRDELTRRLALYPNEAATPLGFGYSDLDTKILESGQHVIATYTDISEYLQLSQQNGQKSWLEDLIQDSTLYNAQELISLAAKNRKQTSECINDTMSCLDNNKQFQAIVWPYHALSDIHIWYRYMILNDADPLIWWWLVNPDSPDRLPILWWIMWYLQYASSSNIALWENTLPAFINNIDIALSRKQESSMREWLE